MGLLGAHPAGFHGVGDRVKVPFVNSIERSIREFNCGPIGWLLAVPLHRVPDRVKGSIMEASGVHQGPVGDP